MNSIYDQRYQCLIQELVGARKDAGLTQVQAANALHWKRSMLSGIETCQRRMDILEAYTLTRLYRIKFDTLEMILAGAPE